MGERNTWNWRRIACGATVWGLLSLTASTASADSMTFDDAFTAVKARNEALAAAQDDVHQREAEIKAAKGLRYPKAELEYRETLLNNPIRIGIDPIPFKLEVQDDNFLKGEVKVTLPLYTGGRIEAANQAAEARRAEAVASGRSTEDQMLTELAQRYYGLCLMQRLRDVQALKRDTMAQHAHNAQRLMEEGIIARVEYLNAEVALANAKTDLLAAERDVTVLQEALTNILVNDTPPEPASPLFVVRDTDAVETYQAAINDDHPVLKMLAAKLDLAKQGVKAEGAADKPTVYLFGLRELVPDDLTMLDPEWAMGIGMQLTLYDGHQAKNKVEAAKAIEQKVIHLTQKARRDLKTLVLKRYEEMSKARDQFDSYDETLKLAKENLRVRTRAFAEGMATSLEVVDATLSQARAQLGRYKAAFDFDVALFQLLEASGRTGDYQNYLASAIPVENETTHKENETVHAAPLEAPLMESVETPAATKPAPEQKSK